MLMHDLIAMGAHKHPDRPAVQWVDGQFTYVEFDERVRRLAGGLRGVVGRGDRVAILAENVPEYVTAYYGVPAAGAVLTFLNYRLHPREWIWILNNSGATVLLVQRSFLDQLEPFLDEITNLRHVIEIGADDARDLGDRATTTTFDRFVDAATPSVAADLADDEIAWIIYTSGTTGFPKGAMLSHRNLLTAVMGYAIESEPVEWERNLVAFPLCHVAGYTVPSTHLRCGTTILAPAFEPGGWIDMVHRFGVTSTALAPTMLDMIVRHPTIDDHPLDTLRTVGYGASAMPVDVLRRALDRFGPIVKSGFGMTELSGNVLVFHKEHHVRALEDDENLLTSCGVPMAQADVRVVDDAFRECATGQVGEIVVRGDQVLTGYYDNPAATAESFRDGWFRTGDMARRDADGFFYIVDRKKDMILTGGENVYSREVENTLASHPDIDDVAVIGLPDDKWGEVVTAIVVPRPGSTLDAEDIVAYARDHLGGYKRPRVVEFVDELPRNVTGKTLKRDLRERFADRPHQEA